MPNVILTQNVVSFVQCTASQFQSLVSKDVDTIYFLTDTNDIYLGETCYTDENVVFQENVPEFNDAATNILYVIKTTSGWHLYVKGATAMEEISGKSPVSTSDVTIAKNITCTVDVGNFKKGDVIDITNVDSLQSFLTKMLTQDSNPIIIQPSVSITLTGAGAKEVGTSFTPIYSASFNPGSYSANVDGSQPTNVTATAWNVSDTDDHTSSEQTSQFDPFTVADNTSYKVSVTVTHTDGSVPTTFLGEPYAAGKIAAGTKSATSSVVSGYRMGFYGSLNDKSGEINSTMIRALSGKSNKKVAKGQKYTVSVPADTQRIIIAYDQSIGDIASITSAEEFGSEIKDSFNKQTVLVEGVNSYTGINYNVYVKDLASPQAIATTYTVTI